MLSERQNAVGKAGDPVKKNEKAGKALGTKAREKTIRTELMAGRRRKVPKNALIGAIAALALCVAVIAIVVVVLGKFGDAASLQEQDIPALASVEGSEVVLDDPLDESQVAYLQISNYPNLSFAPPGTAIASDRDLIARACGLLSGARFSLWDGYVDYRKKTERMSGGYSSALSFLDGNREALLCVSFDPGAVNVGGAPGEGVCVHVGGSCCMMQGDQSAIAEFIGECVDSASSEYRDEATGAYFDFDPSVPHTWVPHDDLDKYEARQSALLSESDAPTANSGAAAIDDEATAVAA